MYFRMLPTFLFLRTFPRLTGWYLRLTQSVLQHAPPLFWCKFIREPLDYRNRCFIVAHCYINGIAPEFMVQAIKVARPNITRAQLVVLAALWFYFDDHEFGFVRRTRYFAYNVALRAVTDLNGVHRPLANRRPGNQGHCERFVDLWYSPQNRLYRQRLAQLRNLYRPAVLPPLRLPYGVARPPPRPGQRRV